LKSNLFNWVIFILLSFIWGSSFILMKEGMTGLSAYQVASIRILSAGLVLLPFAMQAFKAVPANKRPLVFLSGTLGTFFPAYLFCIAETKLDSSLAGILNALTPLFTLLIGASFFNTRIGWQKWAGVLIGFAGLVLLILAGNKKMSFGYLGYASFILLATLLYGINVNLVSRYLKEIGSRQIATVAFTLLIIPSFIILWATGYFTDVNMNREFIYATGASMVLGIFGTAVASILFYVLLKRAGPVFASMVTYGIPFVALFWGVLAHEQINPVQIGCLCIILAGVYLANKKAL
jgi:drug/metabolite transporter (DMT)-like permease